MNRAKTSPRVYNQIHSPRRAVAGKRRFTIYVTWSFPGEANRSLSELDNRFSTMTEVRRVEWPNWEKPEWSDPRRFQQGIAGALELFFRAWMPFQQVIREDTGFDVPVYQRVDQAGTMTPLDEAVLDDTDTLMLFGLDHAATEQSPTHNEIEAVKAFLAREGTCLVIGPHHEVGASSDLEVREIEYRHHGDALVPRQQRFAAYARDLANELRLPVENRFGLRPAIIPGSRNEIAPLIVYPELDKRGWLQGVPTLNFHKHLPHYAVTDAQDRSVSVLAKQPIDLARPHPFVREGNESFNALVWVAPRGERAGDVLFADSTVFSTLFGGTESLKRFWHNLAK